MLEPGDEVDITVGGTTLTKVIERVAVTEHPAQGVYVTIVFEGVNEQLRVPPEVADNLTENDS